jgi:hypothetical protein
MTQIKKYVTRNYTIKEKIDGKGWKVTGGTAVIYASNWQAAKKKFTEWVCDWLGEINGDYSIALFEELTKSKEKIDTFRHDNKTYTIKKVQL